MEERFVVIKISQCSECGGRGVISEPIYLELAIHMNEWSGPGGAGQDTGWEEYHAEENRFMAERGYPSEAKWPIEEYDCEECGGKGKRREEVDLEEALNALRESRHGDPDCPAFLRKSA